MSPVFLKANYSVLLFSLFSASYFFFLQFLFEEAKLDLGWPVPSKHVTCNMQEPLNQSEVKSKQQINVKLPFKRENSMAENGGVVPHLSQAIAPARLQKLTVQKRK